ncbi:hypothetical protein [Actinoplanes xinjiangensis]|uniref:hypothetical protein n=1 Tax=Actinoplanes xinjiangensis TaxID=512350 RepID=UPI003445A568
MPDLSELLTTEAIRLQPTHQPAFTDLVRARRRQRTRLIAGVALIALAGAGGTTAIPGADPGHPDDRVRAPAGPFPVTVTGLLRQVGGPLGTPPRGIRGTVWFRADDGTVTPTPTADSGRFTITVAAGRYVVTGAPAAGDPQQPTCQTEAPLTVSTDDLTGVEVDCHIR